MDKPKVEEYLQQGIYGQKEINPDERRRFLGTLRERVEAALYREQVMEKEVYQEIEVKLKAYPQIHLLLNGHLDYRFLSKYIKLADQLHIKYTIVTNNDYYSEIGVVLAHEEAVNKEEIFIKKKVNYNEEIAKQKIEKKGLLSFIKRLSRNTKK